MSSYGPPLQQVWNAQHRVVGSVSQNAIKIFMIGEHFFPLRVFTFVWHSVTITGPIGLIPASRVHEVIKH